MSGARRAFRWAGGRWVRCATGQWRAAGHLRTGEGGSQPTREVAGRRAASPGRHQRGFGTCAGADGQPSRAIPRDGGSLGHGGWLAGPARARADGAGSPVKARFGAWTSTRASSRCHRQVRSATPISIGHPPGALARSDRSFRGVRGCGEGAEVGCGLGAVPCDDRRSEPAAEDRYAGQGGHRHCCPDRGHSAVGAVRGWGWLELGCGHSAGRAACTSGQSEPGYGRAAAEPPTAMATAGRHSAVGTIHGWGWLELDCGRAAGRAACTSGQSELGCGRAATGRRPPGDRRWPLRCRDRPRVGFAEAGLWPLRWQGCLQVGSIGAGLWPRRR